MLQEPEAGKSTRMVTPRQASGRKSPLKSCIRKLTLDRAGIVLGLIDDIPTCEVLVARIVREAEEVVQGLTGKIRVTAGQEAWDRAASGRVSKL